MVHVYLLLDVKGRHRGKIRVCVVSMGGEGAGDWDRSERKKIGKRAMGHAG